MSLPDPVGPIDGMLTPPNRSIAARVLTALLLLFTIALLTAATKLHNKIDENWAAESDNHVWNIVQFEVDYRDLSVALQIANDLAARDAAMVPAATLRSVQVEFGALQTRSKALIDTLTVSDLDDVYQTEIAILTQAKADWTGQIDALRVGPELPLLLAQLAADVAAIEPMVRRLSADALQVMVTRAEAARLQDRKLLAALYGTSITLIGLTIVSLILSVRLGRSHAAAETRLERSTALAKAAFESSVTAMLICDVDGRILLTNPAASVVFGHTHSALQGHNLEETLIPPERLADYHRFLRFLHQTGDTGDATIGPLQVNAHRASGEVFRAAVLVRMTQLDAEQRLILVFVQDISDQVEFERRLQHAADEARRYANAQRRFLATMSHELRTPLHGVRAALDLLSRKTLADDARALVDAALQSCGHALQQTDNALDAIRATHVNEVDIPFDPAAIARDLIAEMHLIGQTDGTNLTLGVTGEAMPVAVMGKPRAFTRALGNLIVNATKYARGGTVDVRLDFATTHPQGRVMLRAEVIDNGPGIPADKIDRIFEPFNHDLLADQKADRAGFGLGLSIVKQAVDMMNGDIAVLSDRGKGCHVTITLALDRADEQALPPPAPRSVRAMAHRVDQGAMALVVDDAEVNCKLVGQMLSELGYRVDTAHSGPDAIAMAAKTAYDLILMDFHMPMMTGIEAVREIRVRGRSCDARIIGITARIDLIGSAEGDPPEMDGVLYKPFGLAELDAFLDAKGVATAPVDLAAHKPSDALAALRTTLEMCGSTLGLNLLRDTVALAHQAVAQADLDRALCAETAHRAAGAAMMSGLHDLGHALRDLEQAAQGTSDGPALVLLTARLTEAAAQAEHAVSALEHETQALGVAV